MKTNQILSCDKLVDEYNHSYHHSIGKRPIDADCQNYKVQQYL